MARHRVYVEKVSRGLRDAVLTLGKEGRSFTWIAAKLYLPVRQVRVICDPKRWG